MHRLLVLSLLGLTLGSCSSDVHCGDAGGLQGTHVMFRRAFTEPGRYRAQLEWERESAVCEVTLPPTECPSFPPAACGPINMMISLCRISEEQATLVGLSLDVTAASMTLRLSRDGVPVVVETITPDYQTTYPNGVDCGAFKGANVTLDVPD